MLHFLLIDYRDLLHLVNRFLCPTFISKLTIIIIDCISISIVYRMIMHSEVLYNTRSIWQSKSVYIANWLLCSLIDIRQI